MSGRLSALWNAVSSAPYAAGAFASAYLAQHLSPDQMFQLVALLCAAIFPLHPGMTRYAMGVLKSSVHSCFFCYELRRASLDVEISFFERRLGSNRTLIQLLALRREYRNSFTFVVCCILTLVRLHLRTSIDNRFPRQAHSARMPR